MVNNALFSNNTDEWATPEEFYKKLDALYRFDLDPCATAENAKCKKFYTQQTDGLKQHWTGHTVFCNPPYSGIKLWVEKCYVEANESAKVCVMLIPSRTDTKYWHEWISRANRVIFVRGRLRFGHAKNVAPFPSCVVEFRRNREMNPIMAFMDRKNTQ